MRLTEYFSRRQQRSTRRNRATPNDIDEKFLLDAQTAALCDRFRNAKVNPARLAEQDARERMVAKPGPLEAGWTPDGLTRRQIAAARATQALMAMRQEGETPALTTKFDRACAVIDDVDGDLGPIIRGKVFDWQPADDTDNWTEGRLAATTECRKMGGMMTISSV